MYTMSTSKPTYHHGDLRLVLVAAARDLVREFGPAGVSLREAARRAGVSAMAPYRHFADKDALLAAVAAGGFEAFASELVAATALGATALGATASGADARAGLIAQGVAYVRFAMREPALFRLMFGPVITEPASLAALRLAGAPAHAALDRAVAAVLPNAEPSARADLTLAAWSIVHGLACLLVDGKLVGPAGTHVTPAEAQAMAARIGALLLPGTGAKAEAIDAPRHRS